MTQTATSGNKRKNIRRKPPDDSGTYRPGLTEEEKTLRHRKAQSSRLNSTIRSADVREVRRVQAAERRIKAKLKKRRWDPPAAKPWNAAAGFQSVHEEEDSPSVGNVDNRDVSSVPVLATSSSGADKAVPARGESPTFAEKIACDALASLAEGVAASVLDGMLSGGNGSLDSAHFGILAMADQLSSQESDFNLPERGLHVNRFSTPSSDSLSPTFRRHQESSAECNCGWAAEINSLRYRSGSVPAFPLEDRAIQYRMPNGITALPAGVTPLSQMQEISLRVTGSVGELTPVQAAQIQVAKLNSGKLTPHAPDDAILWLSGGRQSLREWAGTRRMVTWHTGVLKAKRRARKAGYTDAAEVLQDHDVAVAAVLHMNGAWWGCHNLN
ncbi:hypothetical protein C8R43DRAFT_961506 [Mycena crocata]|nr:hypothetical protein C8R43DRAFT_961506 [Mycena crocata]